MTTAIWRCETKLLITGHIFLIICGAFYLAWWCYAFYPGYRGSRVTGIRANQGHSIPVDVELEEKTPPDILWHGTGEKYVASIDAQGLIPKSRLYVHLSSDRETAKKVGSRHGRPVIYEIDCRQMEADGYHFFESANHVWLTKEVPVRYLRKL